MELVKKILRSLAIVTNLAGIYFIFLTYFESANEKGPLYYSGVELVKKPSIIGNESTGSMFVFIILPVIICAIGAIVLLCKMNIITTCVYLVAQVASVIIYAVTSSNDVVKQFLYSWKADFVLAIIAAVVGIVLLVLQFIFPNKKKFA